tara:strand:+ start:3724 stop:4818 length:1095 start_codon:yes stop_codon:yes gene_type:complete
MQISRLNLKKLIKTLLNEDYEGFIGGPSPGEGKVTTMSGDELNRISAELKGRDLSQIPPSLQKKIGKIADRAPAKLKKSAARYFKGKSFLKKASQVFGRSFPDSDVFLVPFAGGSREAADLIFGYDDDFTQSDFAYSRATPEQREYFSDKDYNLMSPQRMAMARNRLTSMDIRRHLIFDLFAEGINMLSNLGVTIQEAEKLNIENDIVFVPIASAQPGKFLATPHMILHALIDTTGEKGGTELDEIVEPLHREMLSIANDLGLSRNLVKEAYPDNEYFDAFESLATTKAGRMKMIQTTSDMVSEMLVQELAQYGNKGLRYNLSSLAQFPEATKSKLADFKVSIENTAAQIRELLKGKIVLINVV